jgi:hypothetical protein
MATIEIKKLNVSFISEVESGEIEAVFGGGLLDQLYGSINFATGIVVSPVGGTAQNVMDALGVAINYGGLNGFAWQIVHGGSTGFIAFKPTFNAFVFP